jgi:CheY-like chemotaxis protein
MYQGILVVDDVAENVVSLAAVLRGMGPRRAHGRQW